MVTDVPLEDMNLIFAYAEAAANELTAKCRQGAECPTAKELKRLLVSVGYAKRDEREEHASITVESDE